MEEELTIDVYENMPVDIPVQAPIEFPVEIPSRITLDSIISEYDIAVQKETDINVFFILNLIGSSPLSFKSKLLEWATKRFPAAYPIWSVNVEVPPRCSDGVTRDIQAYLEFCLGMTLAELLNKLQPKFVDIQLTYMFQGSTFSIAVLKA